MQSFQTLQSTRGYPLAYRYAPGREPVVTFLPGFKSDMSGTKATMLWDHCREQGQACLLLDYSGHGVSGGEFIDGSIGQWTRDAVEVIENIAGNQSIVLVGSSMGGWVMLLAALHLKSRVAGILGIAAAPDFTEELMLPGFTDEQKRQLQDEGVVYLPSDYDEPLPVSRGVIEDGRNNLLLGGDIDLHCRSRFVHGMQDKEVPWEISLRTVQQLKATDVQLRLLKDGDHRLSNPEQLAIILQTLDQLIR